MKNYILFDFHLFDGEGGVGDGTNASSSDTTQAKEPQNTVYGKQATGNVQTHGQVGSDQAASVSPDAEFAELIGKGGRFHDIYGQKVSEAIQQRFRNQADLQGQVNQITEDFMPLFVNYGLDAGDFEGLKDAIANDEAFYQAGAERAGLDVETFKEMQKLRADSQRLSQIQESYAEEQERQAMYARWEAETAELQQAVPNFDLGLEIQHSEVFRDYLDKGLSVGDAFFLVHRADVMGGINQAAQAQAAQGVLDNIQRRQARPVENAMQSQSAVRRVSDPSSLTDEDLDEINMRVANGETVSF